jgi:hypothetical protein
MRTEASAGSFGANDARIFAPAKSFLSYSVSFVYVLPTPSCLCVQFVTLFGPDIAGVGVFDETLKTMGNGGPPVRTLAYVRGRWAAAEAGKTHPPHILRAVEQLKSSGKGDFDNRAVTLAFFEEKEKVRIVLLPQTKHTSALLESA